MENRRHPTKRRAVTEKRTVRFLPLTNTILLRMAEDTGESVNTLVETCIQQSPRFRRAVKQYDQSV